MLTFDPTYHNQRPSLLLLNGVVYIAFGSVGDIGGTWHGWLMSYNATTLQQEGIFSDSPNGCCGGIWSSGQGLVADAANNVYLMTGDGDFNANVSGGTEYGDSFVKFGGPSLNVTDYFTPPIPRERSSRKTGFGIWWSHASARDVVACGHG